MQGQVRLDSFFEGLEAERAEEAGVVSADSPNESVVEGGCSRFDRWGRRLKYHPGSISILYYPDRVVVRADYDHVFSEHPQECLVGAVSELNQIAMEIGRVFGVRVLRIAKAYDDDLYIYLHHHHEGRRLKKKIEESYRAMVDFISPEHLHEIEERTDYYLEIIPQDIVSRAIGEGLIGTPPKYQLGGK